MNKAKLFASCIWMLSISLINCANVKNSYKSSPVIDNYIICEPIIKNTATASVHNQSADAVDKCFGKIYKENNADRIFNHKKSINGSKLECSAIVVNCDWRPMKLSDSLLFSPNLVPKSYQVIQQKTEMDFSK